MPTNSAKPIVYSLLNIITEAITRQVKINYSVTFCFYAFVLHNKKKWIGKTNKFTRTLFSPVIA